MIPSNLTWKNTAFFLMYPATLLRDPSAKNDDVMQARYAALKELVSKLVLSRVRIYHWMYASDLNAELDLHQEITTSLVETTSGFLSDKTYDKLLKSPITTVIENPFKENEEERKKFKEGLKELKMDGYPVIPIEYEGGVFRQNGKSAIDDDKDVMEAKLDAMRQIKVTLWWPLGIRHVFAVGGYKEAGLYEFLRLYNKLRHISGPRPNLLKDFVSSVLPGKDSKEIKITVWDCQLGLLKKYEKMGKYTEKRYTNMNPINLVNKILQSKFPQTFEPYRPPRGWR